MKISQQFFRNFCYFPLNNPSRKEQREKEQLNKDKKNLDQSKNLRNTFLPGFSLLRGIKLLRGFSFLMEDRIMFCLNDNVTAMDRRDLNKDTEMRLRFVGVTSK